MDTNASTLGWLAICWLVFTAVVTASTWALSKSRVDSPAAVTACNLLLSLFPPLNLLALTYLSTMDRKSQTLA